MRPLLAFLALATVAVAAPVPKSIKKADTAASIVGIWKPDKASEWFEFDAEGNMKAWTSGNAANPALYTYTVDSATEGRPWRMLWTGKGGVKPMYQAVFVVDGDRMHMTYSGGVEQVMARPDPSAPGFSTTFTREASK